MIERLEFESGFAGGIGKSFDLAMIEVAAAVKDHVGDVDTHGALREELADLGGSGDVGCVTFEALVHAGGRGEGAAFGIVDQLAIDVLVGEIDGETRALRGSGNLAANAFVDPLADGFALDDAH